jgi:hypothetical protein
LYQSAFTDESCPLVSTQQRKSSVTALQDWLSTRPVDPKSLKTIICDAWRGLTAEEPAKTEEPQLIRPGVERC